MTPPRQDTVGFVDMLSKSLPARHAVRECVEPLIRDEVAKAKREMADAVVDLFLDAIILPELQSSEPMSEARRAEIRHTLKEAIGL